MKTNSAMIEIVKFIEKDNNERELKYKQKLAELEKQRADYDEAIKYLKEIIGEKESIEITKAKTIVEEKSLEKLDIPITFKESDDLKFLNDIKNRNEKIECLHLKGLSTREIYETLKTRGEDISRKTVNNSVYAIRKHEIIAKNHGTTLEKVKTLKEIFKRKRTDFIEEHYDLFKEARDKTGLEDEKIKNIIVELRNRGI